MLVLTKNTSVGLESSISVKNKLDFNEKQVFLKMNTWKLRLNYKILIRVSIKLPLKQNKTYASQTGNLDLSRQVQIQDLKSLFSSILSVGETEICEARTIRPSVGLSQT